jgi:hypothetical protein
LLTGQFIVHLDKLQKGKGKRKKKDRRWLGRACAGRLGRVRAGWLGHTLPGPGRWAGCPAPRYSPAWATWLGRWHPRAKRSIRSSSRSPGGRVRRTRQGVLAPIPMLIGRGRLHRGVHDNSDSIPDRSVRSRRWQRRSR